MYVYMYMHIHFLGRGLLLIGYGGYGSQINQETGFFPSGECLNNTLHIYQR